MTLKKALVAITVVAMLFGMVGTAFAGFGDITDTKVAAAATRLSALKIIAGYPDGTFGAGKTITRAEFATIAVRALGLDSAAAYAKGATKFSDVAADHWASGYVNIATQQGVIAGFPDGTFHPEEQVSYAQALTMIVRMLGYSPAVEGKGIWPANYIAKAASIGFTNGVSFNGADAATRGNIALFVDSSLTKPMMYENGIQNGQPVYTTTNPEKTILADVLKADKVEGYLTQSGDLLDQATDTIVVGGNDLTLLDGVSVAGLLGKKVRAWTNSDGDVFFVESITDSSKILTDTLASDSDGSSVALYNADKSYTIDTTLTGYTQLVARNGAEVASNTLKAGDEVTVVVDGTKAVSVVAKHYTTGIVDTVDGDSGVVDFTNGAAPIDLKVTDARVSMTGAVTSYADLEENDVVQYYHQGDNYVVVVTRSAKSGELSKVIANSSGNPSKITVGGTTYSLASGATIDSTAIAAMANFDDLLGANVDVLLNKDGKVAFVTATATAGATYTAAAVRDNIYTAVNSADGSTSFFIKLLKADGTKATLKLASKVTVDSVSKDAAANLLGSAPVNMVIEYALDSDGFVNAIKTYDWLNDAASVAVDDTNHRIALKLMTTSTAYFNAVATAYSSDPADFDIEVIDRATVESNTSPADALVVTDSSNIRAKLVVTVSGESAAANDFYGLVLSRFKNADGDWIATVFTADGEQDYVANAVYTNTVADNVIYATLSGTDIATTTVQTQYGEVNFPAEFDHSAVKSVNATDSIIEVKAVDANSVTLESTYFLVTKDTVIIDNSGDAPVKGTFDTLKTGKTVRVYGSNNVADIIVIE